MGPVQTSLEKTGPRPPVLSECQSDSSGDYIHELATAGRVRTVLRMPSFYIHLRVSGAFAFRGLVCVSSYSEEVVLHHNYDNKTIAFTVSSSKNLQNHNNQRIIYDKVITNTGNAYNKTTGIFTCPVPGTYVFTWSTKSNSAKQSCYAFIYHNGHKLMMTYSYEHTGGYHEVASNTIVLSLKKNELVWIGTTHGTYCYGYPYTGFSGWKL
ncbi:hypothetical protein FSP39_016341 [Pinctada imbricata]|uniref:C1q domain-containing protein n=1 Tax=Pinctada imbricata TaxID=66713 RepID=A0AA89C504_PINIB|nr:hypothetical protein FSP39_016341 [Pinctada imbricata]